MRHADTVISLEHGSQEGGALAGTGDRMKELEPFVGVWRIETSFASGADAPRAETRFEWLEGDRFLIQRWFVEHPDAPDGIAIIGFDEERGTYLQHYFDSRGVARVYEMSFADGAWKLERIAPGFSQRFTGRFDESGDTIAGSWESSSDASTWEHDFDITYERISR
jgi:Protein of unknown function (DUF1579)